VTRIALLSGKGGTGKTSIAASFGFLAGKDGILCDCDVDASNLVLAVGSHNASSETFFGGVVAVIDRDVCISCGACARVCHFDAVKIRQSGYKINAGSCEGCGYCSLVCPVSAIRMEQRKSGDVFTAITRFGSSIVHAELATGAENSGKLSTEVRKIADELAEENGANLIVIDGPPGVSCPAIAASTGVDYVLLVAEPTMSGVHDLARMVELMKTLRIRAGVLVNRADINDEIAENIVGTVKNADLDFWGLIPISSDFVLAARNARTVMETTNDNRITSMIIGTWQGILATTGKKRKGVSS
jgi:MinD superfamily P-loop ATPase